MGDTRIYTGNPNEQRTQTERMMWKFNDSVTCDDTFECE